MGWCVEAVLRLPGESPREAIARVMAGGIEILMTEDGPMMRSLAPIDRRPIDVVSGRERRWMLDAVQTLRRVDTSFVMTAQERNPARRWPYELTVESETAPLWVSVDRQAATLWPVRGYRYTENRDAEWRFWWRCARAFASMSCLVWEPDSSEIVATSMSSAAARDRYNWL
jgi:hypothetical protein